jgi:hypothetical protein
LQSGFAILRDDKAGRLLPARERLELLQTHSEYTNLPSYHNLIQLLAGLLRAEKTSTKLPTHFTARLRIGIQLKNSAPKPRSFAGMFKFVVLKRLLPFVELMVFLLFWQSPAERAQMEYEIRKAKLGG